jgi:hypothetical protein
MLPDKRAVELSPESRFVEESSNALRALVDTIRKWGGVVG